MKSTAVVPPTSFHISYTIHKAARPQHNGLIVLHHGICHTRRHFLPLIRQLTQRGFHAAMIDQQSERAGFFRNCIGADQYVEGMTTAVKEIDAYCRTQGLYIGGYVLHSMGAMIGEEMQQAHPELRRPTVLMAPIPVAGALPVTLRIMRDDLWRYVVALLTLDIHSLASTSKQVRRLFFDSDTSERLVDGARKRLKHAPFWIYCQLLARRLLRPKISNDKKPKLLLLSETDYIFDPTEFDKTRALYDPLESETFEDGGHDFFIKYAIKTADKIKTFFERNTVPAEVVADQPEQHAVEGQQDGKTTGVIPPPHFDEAAKERKPEKQPNADEA